MERNFRQYVLWAGILLLAVCANVKAEPHSQPTLPPTFTAQYKFSWKGLSVARARFSLQRTQRGIYVYKVDTRPTGIISLFSNDSVTETSRFILVDGKPQPLSYRYRHMDGNDLVKQQLIYFDWIHDIARTLYKGKRSTTPLTPRVTAFLLGQLRLSMDMAAGRLAKQYPIINKGKIDIYRMQNAGRKDIAVAAGHYTAAKLIRKDAKSGKVVTLWLSPKLHYLPVKMTQSEPHHANYGLELASFHWDSKRTQLTAKER
jgi:hypothetical protein